MGLKQNNFPVWEFGLDRLIVVLAAVEIVGALSFQLIVSDHERIVRLHEGEKQPKRASCLAQCCDGCLPQRRG